MYKHKIDEKNQKLAESTSITGDDSKIHFLIDFYSKFKEMGLVDPQHYFIDLWKYYDSTQGWKRDKIPEVVNLL